MTKPNHKEETQRAIIGRAGIVAAGTLFSRILGLVREIVLTAVFSRRETDAFGIAFMLPNLLRKLLAEGAVQTGVLPVLAATQEAEGDAAAQALMQRIRGLSLAVLVVVSAAGVVFAPSIVALFAPGFAQDPEKLELTVQLTRWFFPYIFFMGTAALGVAALNTYHRYVVTAFAPVLLNVCFIGCALALPAAAMAQGLPRSAALAVGVLLGGFAQVAAQWPSLHAIGMLKRPVLDLRDPRIREVVRRIAPALFGIGVYYLDVAVGRRLLTDLPEGAVTYFTLGLRLCDFPQGIFVMALQAATLPSLSRLAARRDFASFGSTVSFGLRLSLFVGIPASVALVALSEPIVVAVFQRGQFDAASAHETGRALAAQALGVGMVACVRQFTSAFYALGDTRGPAWVAAGNFVVFALLAMLLRPLYGHVGIGLAVSGASLAQLLLLWRRFRRTAAPLATREILGAAGGALLACGPATVAATWVVGLTSVADPNSWQRIVPGCAGGGAFVGVFLMTAWALRNKELLSLLPAGRKRRHRNQ